MTINITVNDSVIQAKFKSMGARTNASLKTAIYDLVEKLRTHIVNDKLLGQVLNRRTGRLGQSIQTKVTSDATSIVGIVYSAGDVKYAAIHEYGGTVRTRLGTGQGVPKPGGQATFEMPERSYMRSSLADMAQDIKNRLQAAVQQGTQ